MTREHGSPSNWPRIRLAVCLALGVVAGVGLFTFWYAEGVSYFSDDPAACANCHVMDDHYEDWQRGSHHAVAVCNDCHTPDSLIPKYTVKAINGWNHSVAFTTGRFADPFQITDLNVRVAERACRGCHATLVHAIDPGPEELACLRCHSSVGH
ncbi:MAG: cytochrome c nitrite reductase small subunit [Enhygromyxa sp.]